MPPLHMRFSSLVIASSGNACKHGGLDILVTAALPGKSNRTEALAFRLSATLSMTPASLLKSNSRTT